MVEQVATIIGEEEVTEFPGFENRVADLSFAEDEMDFIFPEDFKEFLSIHGSGEGSIGGNYLVIWDPDEFEELNEGYEVSKYAPDLVLFGSDGAGEGVGYDTRFEKPPVVVVPFIGMSMENALPVAPDFGSMLRKFLDGGSLFS